MWYKGIGASIAFTLAINSIVPHISRVSKPFIKCCLRCLDRGVCTGCCKSSVRKHPDTDECNTKKIIQADLNELYTGTEIESFYVFSTYFCNFWTLIAYSGG